MSLKIIPFTLRKNSHLFERWKKWNRLINEYFRHDFILLPRKAKCAKTVIAYEMKTVHEKRFSKSTFMYIGHFLHIWYYVALWYYHSFIHLLTSSFFTSISKIRNCGYENKGYRVKISKSYFIKCVGNGRYTYKKCI